MKVNIVADFKENGKDKNEAHIVVGTCNEMIAGETVKRKLEAQGCVVQSLVAIEGDWTLEELHDIANYGKYMDRVVSRIIYLSPEAMFFMERLKCDPELAKRTREEIKERLR